jgi:hypothetical protein
MFLAGLSAVFHRGYVLRGCQDLVREVVHL